MLQFSLAKAIRFFKKALFVVKKTVTDGNKLGQPNLSPKRVYFRTRKESGFWKF